MAVVKNITKDVFTLGRDGETVRPGKPVEVPDEAFVGRAWPKSTWELVKKPGKGYTDDSVDDAYIFTPTPPEANEKEN